MNLASAEAIVKAVLYEGYILYPYRPSSVKNRQRWTFGSLFPEDYAARDGYSASSMQTECLFKGGPETTIEVQVRFLHLIAREVGRLLAGLPANEPAFEKVAVLRLDGEVFQAWEEAVERVAGPARFSVAELTRSPAEVPFAFTGARALEPLRDGGGRVAGAYIRTSQSVRGKLAISAQEVAPSTYKLTAIVRNTTLLSAPDGDDRAAAQRSALASTHTILGVEGGMFVSLLDPPAELKDAAAGCKNQGTWPVLVGGQAASDTMLSSPIILYDFPQVAPESPGDLFDATEIDEILTLRILGMTDEEKREMASADRRARALLERTEALTPADMERLHGALRAPNSGAARPCERKPELAFLRDGGRDFKVGDRVRLRPKGGADIMDIVLKDELAIIEAIERDFEDRVHVAVVLESDPGRELGLERMPGHRFFFSPEEIEAAEGEGRA
ncbi:MAG: hypothetical protein ACLPPF_08780 [Rhodomicrobium sp.]